MIHHYPIFHSTSQTIVFGSFYLLTGLAIFLYVENIYLMLLMLIFVILITIFDIKKRSAQLPTSLILNTNKQFIEQKGSGDSVIYTKYKVFSCRWFVMLQLYGDNKNSYMLLNSERFLSMQHYQSFRYELLRMQQHQGQA